MKRWCEPGSNTTQCLRGPTKAQWYTDKHGTFSTPTQTKALFSSSALPFLSCSHGSQSKTLKGGALPIYWSTYVIYHSSTSLKYHTKSIWFYSPKPQALHGNPPFIHARHDKACPCDNSLLTLLFEVVSVTLTDQSLFWEWLHHKDIREGLQGFFSKAGNSKLSKKHYLRHHSGKFWCGSDRVQKRICIEMNH